MATSGTDAFSIKLDDERALERALENWREADEWMLEISFDGSTVGSVSKDGDWDVVRIEGLPEFVRNLVENSRADDAFAAL